MIVTKTMTLRGDLECSPLSAMLTVAACKANRFGLQTTPLFDQHSLQTQKPPGSHSVRMG
jgi:hypothetical protein